MKINVALGIFLLVALGCSTPEHKKEATKEEKEKASARAFCKDEAGLDGRIQDTPEDYRKLALYQRCMKRMTGERD